MHTSKLYLNCKQYNSIVVALYQNKSLYKHKTFDTTIFLDVDTFKNMYLGKV